MCVLFDVYVVFVVMVQPDPATRVQFRTSRLSTVC